MSPSHLKRPSKYLSPHLLPSSSRSGYLDDRTNPPRTKNLGLFAFSQQNVVSISADPANANPELALP